MAKDFEVRRWGSTSAKLGGLRQFKLLSLSFVIYKKKKNPHGVVLIIKQCLEINSTVGAQQMLANIILFRYSVMSDSL